VKNFIFYASGSQSLPRENERLHEVFFVGSVDTLVSNSIHFTQLLNNQCGWRMLKISG